MHPASLWKPLKKEDAVQCRLCSHFCVILNGERGRCGVRINQGGQLYTMAYSRVAAVNVDPVEKKPLYHFLPGSRTFSYGAMGCNMGCAFCQNASLSQPPRRGQGVGGQAVTPETLVDAARDAGCASVSATYSEPTVFFELMADTARLAAHKGLANVIVSNGFMSPDCLDELGPLVQAANIDLKAFTEDFYVNVCQARLEPVKKNLVRMRQLGWWLEVTTLVIPGLNDSPEELAALAGFVADELGPDTPWHVSRFHPCHDMHNRPPTPAPTLQAAWQAGKRAGLRYVYVGNLPSAAHGSTMCPACGGEVIGRMGFTLTAMNLKDGACAACGAPIPGVY